MGYWEALTDASAETFAKLAKTKQTEFLKAYYDPYGSISYILARINIHSCDFSSGSDAYVVDKNTDLETFNADHNKKYRTPFMKHDIAAAGGKLTIYASSWSPLAWMKDNNSLLQGGKLLPQYRQNWANYYIKFIKALQKAFRSGGSPCRMSLCQSRNRNPVFLLVRKNVILLKSTRALPCIKKGSAIKPHRLVWNHNRDLFYQRAAKYEVKIRYQVYESKSADVKAFICFELYTLNCLLTYHFK
jgi:glucosylceramidase